MASSSTNVPVIARLANWLRAETQMPTDSEKIRISISARPMRATSPGVMPPSNRHHASTGTMPINAYMDDNEAAVSLPRITS